MRPRRKRAPWPLRLAAWIARHFPERVRVIPDRDNPKRAYLTRIYLIGGPEGRWPWWAPVVAIHLFHISDCDENLHTHPWWAFWSRRVGPFGYWEETPEGKFYRGVGTSGVLWNESPHRVELISPRHRCCTLVIMGPRARTWGFLVDGRLEEWGAYLAAKERRRLTKTI